MEPMLYPSRDFCDAHAISPVTFYRLARGQGPRITRIGGGTFISADDAAAWRLRMADATDQTQVRPRSTRLVAQSYATLRSPSLRSPARVRPD